MKRAQVGRPSPPDHSPTSIRKGKVSKAREEDPEVSNYLDKLRVLLPSDSCRRSPRKPSNLDIIESVIQYMRELQETLDMDAHARDMELLEYETSCITLAA